MGVQYQYANGTASSLGFPGMPDPVLALIQQIHDEMKAAQRAVFRLESELTRQYTRQGELENELGALEQIARRRGLVPPPRPVPPASSGPNSEAEATDDWSLLRRVDAVERLLQKAPGALRLAQIHQGLERHRRHGDPPAAISGTLAHLKRTRGTVVSDGRGRWRYRAPEHAQPTAAAKRQRSVPGAHPGPEG
jgi:hypothetical protein